MNDIPFLDRFGDAMESAIMRQPAQRTWASRIRGWMTLRTGASAAVAASLVALFIVLDPFTGSAPTAFARWTPVPGPVDPEAVDKLDQDCQWRWSPREPEPITFPRQVIIEQRGAIVAALYGDETSVVTCHFMNDGDGWLLAGGAVGIPQPLEPFESPLTVDGIVEGFATEEGVSRMEFTFIHGRVVEEVSSVQIQPNDGPRIEATTKDGFFLAFWPEMVAPRNVTVIAYGEEGDEISRLTPGS